ncbi:PtdP, QbsJ [Alcanivorax sp. 521-1]|uniref:PtdP, QbsJ n=1 Tax=Alloalcanivorax profundimaris TaxID=2735259 RepID=A0ABS0AM56_9GAMM|nr:PtdP, QbsJ [Alloalcanivorax profundimaris]
MQPYWNLAGAAVSAEALRVALALDLFAGLETAADAEAVAGRWRLDPGATEVWLELLWGLGCLERVTEGVAPRYRVSPVAAYYWRPGGTDCRRAWCNRLARLQDAAGQLAPLLRDGATPTPPPGAAWAEGARRQIDQEQRAVTAPLAVALFQEWPELAGRRRLLDLGGGPGRVALSLARAFPDLRATVLDWPEAAEVARQNIAEAGLADRVRALGGDITVDDPGEGYDVIWCSSVLHFVAEPAAVLRRLHRALAPGGVLICAHGERGATAEASARVLPFYLPMMLAGHFVPSPGEMGALLERAGFDTVERRGERGFPLAPVAVWLATRAPR